MGWIKNTSGKPDAVLTMTLVGFAIVMLKFVVSGVALAFGEYSVDLGEVGADDIAAVLGPTLGAYVGRRYTDRKFEAVEEMPEITAVTVDPPESRHDG